MVFTMLITILTIIITMMIIMIIINIIIIKGLSRPFRPFSRFAVTLVVHYVSRSTLRRFGRKTVSKSALSVSRAALRWVPLAPDELPVTAFRTAGPAGLGWAGLPQKTA